MVDTVIGSLDVTVLGGPSNVDLSLDFGPTGERGSYYFVGEGNPNDPDTEIGKTPNTFDLYINLLSTDPEYLFLYQYQYINGNNVWTKLVKLIPNIYNETNARVFSFGEVTFYIPVAMVTSSELIQNIQSSNLSIQHNIINNEFPIISTLSIGTVGLNDGEISIPITIKAKELSGSSFVDLDGSYRVDLSISVV
jgi:hypothetical protein